MEDSSPKSKGAPASGQGSLCRCGCGNPVPARAAGRPPARYLLGHHLRKYPRYLEVPTGYDTPCWIWQLAKLRNGYGFVREGEKMVYAHRLYYERRRGSIPSDLQLDHLCRVRACVNPDHLEVVTPQENIRRGAGTKLNPDAVRAIRASHESQSDIAKAFGISQGHVSRIRKRLTWRDVC